MPVLEMLFFEFCAFADGRLNIISSKNIIIVVFNVFISAIFLFHNQKSRQK
jgi:hypothetical protein